MEIHIDDLDAWEIAKAEIDKVAERDLVLPTYRVDAIVQRKIDEIVWKYEKNLASHIYLQLGIKKKVNG